MISKINLCGGDKFRNCDPRDPHKTWQCRETHLHQSIHEWMRSCNIMACTREKNLQMVEKRFFTACWSCVSSLQVSYLTKATYMMNVTKKKKKTHLLFFKDLLVGELTDKVAEMEPAPKRKSHLSVAAVERLVPQSHFIMLVKDDRNCRNCSGTLKHTSTECAPCTGRHEYRRYWQVVPQFFILLSLHFPFLFTCYFSKCIPRNGKECFIGLVIGFKKIDEKRKKLFLINLRIIFCSVSV